MPNLRMTLSYVGTAYHGWQIQPDRPTVQGLLKSALETVLRQEVLPYGAARTDAGVHALGQVASARVEGSPDRGRLLRSLNAVLPHDIAVRAIEEVPDSFHARHSAVGRVYRYRIAQGPVLSPFERGFVSWVRAPLDRDAMEQAGTRLLGTHDFSSFRGAGDVSSTTFKTLRRCAIGWQEEAGILSLTVEADSFLQYMVRTIAGTLVEVGRGRLRPEAIDRILAGRDRRLAGPTAPAEGLFLVEVRYRDATPPPDLAYPEGR